MTLLHSQRRAFNRHMQKRNTPTRKRLKRRGILSMELVLTLPVLIVLLLGIFEFTCLFFTYGSVVEASRAGARKATLHGVYEEDVYEEVSPVTRHTSL